MPITWHYCIIKSDYVDTCVHYLLKRKQTPKTIEPVNIEIQTKQYSNVEYKDFTF